LARKGTGRCNDKCAGVAQRLNDGCANASRAGCYKGTAAFKLKT
jgi:hypothetical protein